MPDPRMESRHDIEGPVQAGGSLSRASSPQFRTQVAALRPILVRTARHRGVLNAEDLAHDAIEKALRNESRYRPGTNLAAWAVAILNNTLIDGLRSARHRRETLVGDVPYEAVEPPEEEPWWLQLTAEDIDWAVRQLPAELQAVYALQRQGLRYREVGAKLGIQVSTVATRLFRARRQIRTLLTERHDGRRRES